MKKDPFYGTANNSLNPLSRQWFPRSRGQLKDKAFFLRKLSFVKCQLQDAVLAEEQAAENEGVYENDWQHTC